MTSTSAEQSAIGFYTVEYSEALGWTGGYLLLNEGGRPLEFHCTLPVRPSRSHEILYGSTLRSYLIGEAIGEALLSKAKASPALVCIDQIEALEISQLLRCPVAMLHEGRSNTERTGETLNSSNSAGTTRPLATLGVMGERFSCVASDESVVHSAIERFDQLPDWREPFGRIREAIREAQQGAVARAA